MVSSDGARLQDVTRLPTGDYTLLQLEWVASLRH